jgi:hypothetical protein
MADSYELRDGQVIPFSGGRMHTDTTSWRDATELELEQQAEIERLEKLVEELEEKIVTLEEAVAAAVLDVSGDG